MTLPTVLPIPTREYPLIKPSEVQNLRVIYFADQFPGTQNPYVGIDFLLNGQQYDVTQDTGMMQNFLIKWRDQPFPPSLSDPRMHPRLRPLLKMPDPHRM